MAHAGHHFVDLVKTDKSTTVAAPDSFIDQFYGIKREVKGMPQNNVYRSHDGRHCL